MEEEKAVNVLREIKQVFDKCGLDFWLKSGALLGAVREGRLISWDIDIDLGTWDYNFPKMKFLSKEFCERGYESYYSYYHNVLGMKKHGIDTHIVFWRLINDEARFPLAYIENFLGRLLFYITWILLFSYGGKVNYETLNTRKKKVKYFLVRITDYLPELVKLKIAILLRGTARRTGNRRGLVVTPSTFFLNLSEIEFYGMKFNAPADTEGYLVYYFGEDWRIPKTEWNYITEDRSPLSKTERFGREWKYLSLRELAHFLKQKK